MYFFFLFLDVYRVKDRRYPSRCEHKAAVQTFCRGKVALKGEELAGFRQWVYPGKEGLFSNVSNAKLLYQSPRFVFVLNGAGN